MKTLTRRRFLSGSTLAAGSLAFPNLLLAHKSIDKKPVLGAGEHLYEVDHDWCQLPEKYHWQITHNVAVDKDHQLYVIHEGNKDLKDHPAIFVFDKEGKFVRAFGKELQGGGHGLEIRTEGGEQFLYVTAYLSLKWHAKMTLTGEIVWKKHAPMDSGHYAEGEDKSTENKWGRNRFMPTNYAFHPTDGSVYMADGYGAHRILRYDKDGNYLSSFGKPGKADGEFNLPHGLWIDDRGGRAPSICVADRANGRLQWFDLDGKHLKTMTEPFILPANVDVLGDLMLVPDLSARLSLLNKDDKVIHLSEDTDWRKTVLADKMKYRREPDGWATAHGRFIHPHDACFDPDGNIYLAEWVSTGRVTRLRKV